MQAQVKCLSKGLALLSFQFCIIVILKPLMSFKKLVAIPKTRHPNDPNQIYLLLPLALRVIEKSLLLRTITVHWLPKVRHYLQLPPSSLLAFFTISNFYCVVVLKIWQIVLVTRGSKGRNYTTPALKGLFWHIWTTPDLNMCAVFL
jgi:hypothetical protein